MNIKQKKTKFKDFSLNFNRNPITNDVISLDGYLAVRRSVVNLVLTCFHERPYQRFIGTGLYNTLFETYDIFVKQRVEEEIKNVLDVYEPRVRLLNIDVEFVEIPGELIINLRYFIISEDMEDSTKIVYRLPR